jgi:uncharacterized protein DUF1360
MPGPFAFVVLALAAYRLTRLAGWDTFPLAERVRAAAVGEYRTVSGTVSYRRPTLDHFVHCPFCIGFWISLGVYAAWLTAPTVTMYGAMPFAISGAVGLVAKNLDP